ncbi:MAG: phosphoribosyltransferase family protein [Syntrophobacteria bacterium]
MDLYLSPVPSLLSRGSKAKPIKEFIVRKQSKDHGIPAQVEGECAAGDRVVVVDDVITTGGSTIAAIKAVEKIGLQVHKVLVLVDREEMNGRQNIERYCSDVEALIRRSEVMLLYKRRRGH